MGYEYELCHYGVKGMKWGVRRKQNNDKLITVRQANVNARKATINSLRNDRASGGVTIRQANKNAKQARKNSVQADKAYNKQVRENRKQQRKAAIADNLARERSVSKERAEVAKLGVKVAAVSVVGAAAVAGIVSAIGSRTPAQVTSYANVGRTIVNTASISRIPISTVPIKRTSW